jgi:bifunctional non-homologous end joining protein LigD
MPAGLPHLRSCAASFFLGRSEIKLGQSILAALQGIRREPRRSSPRPDAKDAHWAEPQLVCDAEFTRQARDGRVRQPAFKGLREGNSAKGVRRATPKG